MLFQNDADAEFIFQPDEQMLVPEQVAVEKSGSPSLNQAAEVGVANDEDAPTTEQNVPNGETEVSEKNGEEAMAESGPEPEPEAEAESGPEAEGMSRDEVENAINEQELKYWSAVRENPNDFTSWTYLLQFVEQEVGKTNSFLQTKKPCRVFILDYEIYIMLALWLDRFKKRLTFKCVLNFRQ